MSEAIRVLLVDPEEAAEERLAAVLAEADEGDRLRLSRVAALDGVPAAAARGEADVVLLPLHQTLERGVLPVVELRAVAPELPVVVLAETDDEPLAMKAVQLGAADYLITDQLYGTLLTRCLRHAVEVARVRSRLARQEAEWPPSLFQERGGDARAASLRAALPQRFEELVGDYRQILDRAVEQVLYRREGALAESIGRLARRAGELWAGPRDMVEIHTAVTKEKQQREGPQRIRLYVAEGQVRLLELMGHLAVYYRRLSLGRRRPAGG